MDVEWTERALHDFGRLDPQVRERIRTAVERYAATSYGDVKRLRGEDPEWRLRVGDWRVRFLLDVENNVITILHVLPRGRAYRR